MAEQTPKEQPIDDNNFEPSEPHAEKSFTIPEKPMDTTTTYLETTTTTTIPETTTMPLSPPVEIIPPEPEIPRTE